MLCFCFSPCFLGQYSDTLTQSLTHFKEGAGLRNPFQRALERYESNWLFFVIIFLNSIKKMWIRISIKKMLQRKITTLNIFAILMMRNAHFKTKTKNVCSSNVLDDLFSLKR